MNPTAQGCADAQPNDTDLPAQGAGPQCWEQQQGEPNNFYLAFVEYLKLGRARNKQAALEAASRAGVAGLPRLSTFRQITADWRWNQRARAWDGFQATTTVQASLDPWAQRPNEPDRYYRLLLEYLKLGRERSVNRALVAARQAGVVDLPTAGTCRASASAWQWHERARAWDLAHTDETAGHTAAPWEQQVGESARAYGCFQAYLQLGSKRTLPAALNAAAAGLGVEDVPSLPALTYMSTKWGWRQRAAAWDEAHPQLPTSVETKPWDQLPKESDNAYAVFKHYLALGPLRTIGHAVDAALAQDGHSLAHSTVAYYARFFHWRERAEAWDEVQLVEEPSEAAGEDVELAGEGGGAGETERQPWDRQPKEPPRAYSLFCHYLELGPSRTVARVYRDWEVEFAGHISLQPSYGLVKRWRWAERAAAWDAYQRDRVADKTMDLTVALQQQQLEIAAIWMDQAVYAFEIANLPGLDEVTARRMLPIIHRMMVDSGAIQRLEMDRIAKRAAAAQTQGKVTAETMYAFDAALAKARAEEAARQAAAQAEPTGVVIAGGRAETAPARW